MRVTIKELSGKLIPVDVNGPDETIEILKLRIFEKEFIAPDEQHLVFQNHELEDEQTLNSCGIVDGCTVNLEVRPNPENENVENAKQENIQSPNIQSTQIDKKSPIEKIVELSINSADNVQSIKNRIQQNEGIPTDKQMLFFKGKKLDDQQKLQEFNIKNNDQFYLLAQDEEISQVVEVNANKQKEDALPKQEEEEEDDDAPKVIKVTFKTISNSRFVLDILSTDTVLNIKQMLPDLVGIPLQLIRLRVDGNQLANNHTLDEYNIQNESVISVLPYMGPGG